MPNNKQFPTLYYSPTTANYVCKYRCDFTAGQKPDDGSAVRGRPLYGLRHRPWLWGLLFRVDNPAPYPSARRTVGRRL